MWTAICPLSPASESHRKLTTIRGRGGVGDVSQSQSKKPLIRPPATFSPRGEKGLARSSLRSSRTASQNHHFEAAGNATTHVHSVRPTKTRHVQNSPTTFPSDMSQMDCQTPYVAARAEASEKSGRASQLAGLPLLMLLLMKRTLPSIIST